MQDTSTVPYPFNHAPQGMKPADISVKEFPDMTSAYCYNFHTELSPVETSTGPGFEKRACVKHVFTGPYGDLKTQATEVFYQIQGGLELMWQSVSTGIADGILTLLICDLYLTKSHFTATVPPRSILFLGIAPSRLGRR